MKNSTTIYTLLRTVTGIALFSASILAAQSAPVLKPAYSGARGVAGTLARGVREVSIYDLSYAAETKLGTGTSVDANGNFVVIVKSTLIEGHQIVAVDGRGVGSNVVVVGAPPKGPNVPPRAR